MWPRLCHLAWCHLRHHRVLTLVLLACLTTSLFMPYFTWRLSETAGRVLGARAAATPLVVGRRGGALQLVLNTLYFRSETPELMKQADYIQLCKKSEGLVVPLHNRHRARGCPVVGTSLDYFALRELVPASGSLPARLGDAVLGWHAAQRLGLDPGASLLSDTGSLYNISAMVPLEMRITGVLARSGTPDDQAVFVDVKTAWIMDGLSHGHEDLQKANDGRLLARSGNSVVASPAVLEYTRISDENIDSFHFHGDDSGFPLTGVVMVPASSDELTIIKGSTNLSDTLQALSPAQVIDDLMKLVFDIRRMLGTYFVLVGASTLLFLALIFSLSLRLRARERSILHMMGGGRHTILALMGAEMAILFATSLALAFLLSEALVAAIVRLQWI